MSRAVEGAKNRRAYTPAVGPKLRPFLWITLGGFALLAANGVYLGVIRAISWRLDTAKQTPFYYYMFLLHLALGFALVGPFLIFGLGHLATSWRRPNKGAVRYGLALLGTAFVVLITGLILVRIVGVFEIRDPKVRDASYWLHIGAPVLAIVLYVRHRLAGPRIHWEYLRVWGSLVGVFVVLMGILNAQDPRTFAMKGPREGDKYFYPSHAKTATGKFIPAKAIMLDKYCMECHKDTYDGWFHSAHHFASFNNPMYLFSVRETRKVSIAREGSPRAARWCAGCHDPAPFFSGEFDDPNYDDVHAPTSQAGITCVTCHSIVHVNSTRGNADYTIEEPQVYPFTYSEVPALKWINKMLVKAKPEMHKKTFLKPLHKDSAFCSTCHKVSIPYEVTRYKDFLRGQNHYDSFLLSGTGHGARSFYYPPKAKNQCVSCHMNLVASNDFGARDFDGTGERKVHDHMFPDADTGLAAIVGDNTALDAHIKFLKDKQVRIDIFGVREGGTIEGRLTAPLRPESIAFTPGESYLIEVVTRTLGLGHPLTQGTVDSNEIWVELIAKAGDRVIGRSGGIDREGYADPYSHFLNVYMLDKNGKRIDRRNAHDIFVPLYNKQIPPGAGNIAHFRLEVPRGITGPIELTAKVNYRKFDRKYMDYVYGKGKGPELPIVVMASDSIRLPVKGEAAVDNPPSPIKDEWQRWNDYGIGLFLEGEDKGGAKGELKQAEHAFKKVVELDRSDGWVNLGRVYLREGRIPEAVDALDKAGKHKTPAAPWVIAWLTGQINMRNGYFDEAIERFESILATKIPSRNFDFSKDYEVIDALGSAYYSKARQAKRGSNEWRAAIEKTIETYRRTLEIDSENIAAHYNLGIAYSEIAAIDDASQTTEIDQASKGTTSERLIELANATTRSGRGVNKRIADARSVGSGLKAFLEGPRPGLSARIDPLFEVVEKLGAARAGETDRAVRGAEARSLAIVHKALHAMIKPDDNAEGRAFAIARRDNPAADQYAQSIVIHSLNRPGAPGVDSPRVAVTEVHP